MNKYHILIVIFLITQFACNSGDTDTQIITQIVEVPPAEPQATDIALNITASELEGDLTHNGGTFPFNDYDAGEFGFSGVSSTDQFIVGSSSAQSYVTMVVDGAYDISYQFDAGGVAVPLNQNALLLNDRTINGNETIDLDVTSVSITPQFTLNGGNFPASQYDRGSFFLQPVATAEWIFLGYSNANNAPVLVTPGNYHVIYDYIQGTISPVNKGARVMSNVALNSDQPLAVNVQAGDFRADFTLNGNAFPVSQYNNADFYLKDLITQSESVFMKSYDTGVSIPVIDGNYDILYKVVQGINIPINSSKVIVSDLNLSGGGALNYDIASVSIGANLTLNGNAFQVSEYQDAIIELYDPQTQSFSLLGNTHGEFNDISLIPGNYDIIYSHETGDAVPQNIRGTITSDQLIDSDTTLDIAVMGIVVTTDLTLNTATFPPSQYQTADLLLTGNQSKVDILVAATSNQDEGVMVLPGSYDLYYRHKQGDEVPQNTHYLVLEAQNLQADITLSEDIKLAYIRVSATLNQQPFPQSQYQTGDIYASSGEDDEVFVLETHNGGDIIMVIPAEYQFYYQHINGDGVPLNLWALIGSSTVAVTES